MHPVEKAIWYLESHLGEPVSVDALAAAVGSSPYHLVRSFGAVTGVPPIRYLRLRRLTKAAMTLVSTQVRIVDVALDAGFCSHEAFTRAFVSHFGVTPMEVRREGSLANMNLQEPIMMMDTPFETIADPKIVDRGPLLVVGTKRRYNRETAARIPSQWQEFAPHIGHIPNVVGDATFGVCFNGDGEGNLDYLCGVEVCDFTDVPHGLDTLRAPSNQYAVFEHVGHVSEIRRTWQTIFRNWMPANGRQIQDAPDFERYGKDFDPRSGTGRIEIWLPLAP